MKTWTFPITYGKTQFQIRAELEFESNKVMRIRVYGTKGTMLFENDYPAIYLTKSRKGVTWKIREGEIKQATKESTQFLIDLFNRLESMMKAHMKEKEKGRLGFTED